MNKSLLLPLAGAVLILGCSTERQSQGSAIQPVAVKTGNSGGLEFLADIPSLKDVSLKMPEAEFLDILHREKLAFTLENIADQTSYYVHPKPRAVVIFTFRNGHCSGIQRGTDAAIG